MSRAGHVAVVSAISRPTKTRDEFTDLSTISTLPPVGINASDGQPLWPWHPKRPEKYSLDRAGLPKREELSSGLKLRKACGILLMVVVIFALVIGIYVHFSNSDVDPSNLTHKHETHNKDGEISVHDNHSMQGNYTKNETDF